MRRAPRTSRTAAATIAFTVGALGFAPAALAQGAGTEPELRAAIAAQMAQGPAAAGAYVVVSRTATWCSTIATR